MTCSCLTVLIIGHRAGPIVSLLCAQIGRKTYKHSAMSQQEQLHDFLIIQKLPYPVDTRFKLSLPPILSISSVWLLLTRWRLSLVRGT
jgi:hypothetical protein